MKALLDLGLFMLGAEQWASDRRACLDRIAAVATHAPWLRGQPVHLLWSDVFFEGFPWNQPECPRELLDLCNAMNQLLESSRGRRKLLLASDLPPAPTGTITLTPDLVTGPHPPHIQAEFRALAAAAALTEPAQLAIPTSPAPEMGHAREVKITVGPPEQTVGTADLLLSDDDWHTFLRRHKKPDLAGHKVAVLGGSRAPFERARKTLEAYGLTELRRLPPAFEETRTKQDTLQRLEKMDLLLVCTNRCKHTDTDHLKTGVPCPRIDLNSDGENALVEAVLDHFRDVARAS